MPGAQRFVTRTDSFYHRGHRGVNRNLCRLDNFCYFYKKVLFSLYSIPSCNFVKAVLSYSHKRWYQCTGQTLPKLFQFLICFPFWNCFPSSRRHRCTAMSRNETLLFQVSRLFSPDTLFQNQETIRHWKTDELQMLPSIPDYQVNLTLRNHFSVYVMSGMNEKKRLFRLSGRKRGNQWC